MMNNNNVFTFGYYNKRAIWHNIKHFFKTIKWAWQRATKGYCDFDRWDIEAHLRKTLLGELREYKEHLNGYPGYMTSMAEWEEVIDDLLYHLTLCNEDAYNNRYAEEYHKSTFSTLKLNDGNFVYYNDPDENAQMIRKKFFEREKEIGAAIVEHRKAFYELLGKYISDLWD